MRASARPSIREVAAAASVSVGTVSNYLNRPELVAPATAERIRAAIDALGFVPDEAARTLRTRGAAAIAYLAWDLENSYFSYVAEQIEAAAAERGLLAYLANCRGDLDIAREHIRRFEQQRVRGLVAAAIPGIGDALSNARRRGMPSVVIGGETLPGAQASVSLDDRPGGRLAVEHLVAFGRRRIAVVGGPRSLTQLDARVSGAQDAAAAVPGVELVPVETVGRAVSDGRRAAAELLAACNDSAIDAVFALNDTLALGVMQELLAAGRAVPADVAVVGFDDSPAAMSSAIPLTSVGAGEPSVARSCVALLLGLLEGGEPRHQVLAPQLMVRASSTETPPSPRGHSPSTQQ